MKSFKRISLNIVIILASLEGLWASNDDQELGKLSQQLSSLVITSDIRDNILHSDSEEEESEYFHGESVTKRELQTSEGEVEGEFIKNNQCLTSDTSNEKEDLGSNDLDDFWDNLSCPPDEIVVFRGYHLFFDHPIPRKEISIVLEFFRKFPLYSSAACSAEGVNFCIETSGDMEKELETCKKKQEELNKRGKLIREKLDQFKKDTKEVRVEREGKKYKSSYDFFHEVYSNDHRKFHALLNAYVKYTPQEYYTPEEVFSKYLHYFLNCQEEYEKCQSNHNKEEDSTILSFLRRNPFISCSTAPKHALKYAVGNKVFYEQGKNHKETQLDKLRKEEFRSKLELGNPAFLGLFYSIAFNEQEFNCSFPTFVPQLQAEGRVSIRNTSAKNILSESEISFPGMIDVAPKNIKIKAVICISDDDQPESYDLENFILLRLIDISEKQNLESFLQQKEEKLLEEEKGPRPWNLKYLAPMGEWVRVPIAITVAKILGEACQNGGVVGIIPSQGQIKITEKADFDYLFCHLGRKKITHLNIVDYPDIGKTDGMNELWIRDLLAKNKELKEIRITKCSIETGFFLHYEMLPFHQLVKLDLSGNPINSINHIMLFLKKNPPLQSLSLAGTRINDWENLITVKVLHTKEGCNSNLIELHGNDNYYTGKYYNVIMRALIKNMKAIRDPANSCLAKEIQESTELKTFAVSRPDKGKEKEEDHEV
ncbi:MAG: hypothetical protein IBJ00_02325 [Alphaproteobacteria bacterium]|nr:hypothetical protein [Alphaproteobacteria bacterium]